MLNKSDVDYFNSGDLENKKFWKRLGGKPNLENKSVLELFKNNLIKIGNTKIGPNHLMVFIKFINVS